MKKSTRGKKTGFRKTIKNRKNRKIRKTIKNRKTIKKQIWGGKPDASFKKSQCAPKSDKIQKYSCYSEEALGKMRDLWNTRHKDAPISSDDPREIWNELKQKLKNACKSESCWLKQNFMDNNLNDELLNNTFAPKSPSKWKENHNMWLNSTDIEKVMKQYEHSYPCFRFIGPTPIDFDAHVYKDKCVWDDLCKFELSKYINEDVNKIGIIFNTDPHTKGGAHWISLFINIKKGYVFFFDSNGTEIPKEIKTFANRIIDQAAKLDITLKFDQNEPFAHQEGNTECGMYSLYLIVSLLKDSHPYTFFKKTKISDAAMEHLRDKYYNIN